MENFSISTEIPQQKFAPDNAQIVGFLISIQFIGFFFWGGFRTIFPFILTNLGYSSNQIATYWSVVFTIALFTGGFLTRIPMGILSDKLSRKQGLLFGTGLSLFSILLMNFSSNIIILGILLALLRTGTHIFPLTTRGYSNETNPKKQSRLNGYVLIGTDVASFVGPILLGFFLEISLRTLIIFSCSLLLLVSLILNYLTPKKLKRKDLPVIKIFVQSIKELSQIWKMIGVFLIIGLINGIYGEILVPFASTTLNLSNIVTELYVGVIQVTSIIFILISVRLNRRYGLFYLIISGILFILTGAIVIYIGQLNVITFVVGSMLISGGVQVNINSLVTSVTLTASKETAATSFGIASGCFFLGASFIPIFAGYLFNINPFYPYIVMIFISVFVLFLVIYLKGEYQHTTGFRNHH